MYTCRSHEKKDCRDAVCRRQAECVGLVTATPSKSAAVSALVRSSSASRM